jgi:GNAT superfamily N-acetyltransferase
MQIANEIILTAFGPEHIDGAVALSRQVQWPHRPEDWRMALSLSAGTVAVDAAGHVVGTIIMTPYQQDCAAISMVDEALRGHGLGRRLMLEAIAQAGTRPLRLTATTDGLSLYRKLGFVEYGEIRQHQGAVQTVGSPGNVQDAAGDDIAAIKTLDRAAFGADRGALIDLLAASERLAVIRRNGQVEGFAAIRAFGHGEVIGPVVAADPTDAKALVAFFAAPRTGAFLRIDTPCESGLSGWLGDIGLAPVGGGIVMHVPSGIGPTNAGAAIFALASQAFG